MADHLKYLARSVELAQIALKRGDVPIGAILVNSEGRILCEAQNTIFSEHGLAYHAEAKMLFSNQKILRRNSKGLFLYSSLEPCIMCLSIALVSHLECIAWALNDYWAGGTRSLNFDSNYLKTKRHILIPPISSSLQAKSASLLSSFIPLKTQKNLN